MHAPRTCLAAILVSLCAADATLGAAPPPNPARSAVRLALRRSRLAAFLAETRQRVESFAPSATRRVNCDLGQSLNEAVQRVAGYTTFEVVGTCREHLRVRRPGIRILGAPRASLAPPSSDPEIPAIRLESASGVEISGLLVDYAGALLSATDTRPLLLGSITLADFADQAVVLRDSAGYIGGIDAPRLVVAEHSIVGGGPRVSDVTVESHSTADFLFYAIGGDVRDLTVRDHSTLSFWDQARWDRISVSGQSRAELDEYGAELLEVSENSFVVLGNGGPERTVCSDSTLRVDEGASAGTLVADRCAIAATGAFFDALELRDHSHADLVYTRVGPVVLARFSDLALRENTVVGDVTCSLHSRVAIEDGTTGTLTACWVRQKQHTAEFDGDPAERAR